jgi:hypothetical protein
MEFWQLVTSDEENIDVISDWLDRASVEARLEATRSLSRAAQRRLFEKAAKRPAMTFADLVPDSVGEREEVIHQGWNTLPLPPPLRRFEKRFCRPEERSDMLFGYNEGLTRGLIGPGYFVAVSTEGKVTWEERGGIAVDYFRVPDSEVVEGWPRVKPNSKGLQVLVYHRTRDFMRSVSAHVSIGAAYKDQKPLDHYFMLCRQDAETSLLDESTPPAREP